MITKIRVENVKGYGVPGKEISVTLDPHKVNLCIAPNGFGKSSLATAFESMNRNRLDITEENKHYQHIGEESSLCITLDGHDYIADNHKNEIIPQIRPYVIHNRTQVDYIKRRIRTAFVVNAFMEISPIIVCPIEAPVRLIDFYSIGAIKEQFGNNKKIVDSIERWLKNDSFCQRLADVFPSLQRFETKKRWAVVSSVVNSINSLSGNKEQVLSSINDSVFADLEAIDEYKYFNDVFHDLFIGLNKYEVFNVFYQLCLIWSQNGDKLRKLNKRASYLLFKRRIDTNLQLINSTGRIIQTTEKDGNLIVTFPHADEISNGQRDVLTFATELMIFKAIQRPENKYLLIIDEVFDYLDDANTIAAQYYLSQILNLQAGNVYILLLTHLNPFSFRNYVFNPKIINEVYLEEVVPIASEDMMRFISFRSWLDPQKHPERQAIYDSLSRDIFHYNPNASDWSADIASFHREGVKSRWGNPVVFRQVLISELNKYLSGNDNYDPYAISIALRLRVEKVMYESLATEELKRQFVSTHKTNEKFLFCEQHSIAVPDAFFIVNSIHNEADHLKQNPITGAYDEKAMVYKLQNGVIHSIVEHLFNYNGAPLDSSLIS